MARRAYGEGTLYYDESKTRWIGALTVDGKRRKVVCKTKAEARARLTQLGRDATEGRAVGDGNSTLGPLLERWKTKVLPGRGLAMQTENTYRWALDILDAELGSKRLRSLTPDEVERAFERIADRNISRGSLVKIRSVLSLVLDYAERRGLTTRNVAKVAELPADARRPTDGRALTIDEAGRLLAAAAASADRLYALWVLMLMLGLRPGEATALGWDAVNLDTGVVVVRRNLRFEAGEFVLGDRLKTSTSRRSLDMPSAVVVALRAHRRRQAEEHLAAGSEWSTDWPGLVFTTEVGTPIHASNLRRSFAKVTEAAGLGRWHPHELRHSAASILSDAGVRLECVADLLGHDGTRMTALVYRHAMTPSVDAARETMDALFGSTS